MNLIDLALNKSRTFYSLLLFIFVAGVYSYISIPKESSPDIPIPTIYVSLHHDGISPEDSVNLLIKPMERELKSVEGLDEMESTAYEGGGNIILQFNAGFDNKKALDDVRNAVDLAKADLPEEADEPVVTEINIAKFPVLQIILGGDVPERELKQVAKDLRDDLEGLSQVLEAPISGMREEQVIIEFSKSQFESYPIAPSSLGNIVNNANLLIAAGSLEMDHGKYAIKVPGLFKKLEDFLRLPILSSGEKMVSIDDIANVRLGFKDATEVDKIDGKRSITVSVSKRIGKNVIDTVNAAKEIVETASKTWPNGVTYRFTGDSSKEIKTMLYDLQNSILISIILVMIVILAALGPRSALLVATAIPGSFLMAMTALFALGFTTNVVVLFALILSVGMLVDGAIVVTELADSRMREGASRHAAFSEAANYMAMPIISSTLTTLAAFMPLLFWPDVVGEFMKFMPLTLIFTLTASLIMALIFLPLIGATVGKRPTEFPKDIFAPLSKKYHDVLAVALNFPGRILIGCVCMFFASIALYAVLGKGVEFFPQTEAERANIYIRTTGDYSLKEREKLMDMVAHRVGDLEGTEAIIYSTQANISTGRGAREDAIGKVFIQPVDFHERSIAAEAIYDEAVKRIGHIPGVVVELEVEQGGPSDGKPIKIAVVADDTNVLIPVAAEIKKRLEDFEGTTTVTDSAPDPGIEWVLDVDRAEAAKSGLTLQDVGIMVRLTTTGAIIGKYRPSDRNEELDIVARFKEGDRNFATMNDLSISTENGLTPISNFVERSAQDKVTTIKRLDQKNVIYVEADINRAGGYLASDIIAGLKAELDTTELPRGVRLIFKGDDEQQAESAAFLQSAFLVALAVMAIILITQFNSFYQAFIILSAVILSTMGVLLGHIIMMKPFGIVMSGLGVIALAGIVVNNNIVLIDTYNKLVKEMHWREALLQTGMRRLRPVLLTAITTVIGLLPMGLKLNVDLMARELSYNTPSSRWWDQLANSIMFGLVFATVLTLIITPCMIAIVEQRKERKVEENKAQ